MALEDLLNTADIVSVHVDKARGTGVLGATEFNLMNDGAIIINAAFAEAIDNDALLERATASRLRAALDYPLDSHPTCRSAR